MYHQFMNTPIPQGAISVPREALPLSNMMSGLGGMNPPNAGMMNADDGGAMSKPYVNAQPTENAFLASQEMQQNMRTGSPQQAAAAMGMVKQQEQQVSNAQNMAQMQLNERMMQELVKRGSGNTLMEVGAIMGHDPSKQKFINDIEVSKAMFSSEAPELGAHRASVSQYS
jgi:hypothetical protein